MPFFDRRIDAVVLTHPHADHYLGLIPALARYRVGRLLTAGMDGEASEYAAFLAAAADAGLRPARVQAGDRIALGNCATADVLWPPPAGVRTDDPNEASVVLRVALPDRASPRAAALLMGDATADVEAALVASGEALGADVLKVGHHGSRFSTSAAFIDAVRPGTAIVSVGRNRYGHPAAAALMRLAKRGVRVLRTDEAGDVRIVVAADRAYAEGY
jgi:competence protein ComEC